MLIGLALLAAAGLGYFLYKRKKDQGQADTGAGAPAPAETGGPAPAPKPQGNLGPDKISQDDLAYLKQSAGLPSDFTGVDYNNPKNTLQANQAYLAANPDVITGWADKASDGSVVGWSHYVIWGQKEGRVWPV